MVLIIHRFFIVSSFLCVLFCCFYFGGFLFNFDICLRFGLFLCIIGSSREYVDVITDCWWALWFKLGAALSLALAGFGCDGT